MKKTHLLLLTCFLAAIATHGQSENQIATQNNPNISSLMMFGGGVIEENPAEGTKCDRERDSRQTTPRNDEQSGAGGSPSSQVARGSDLGLPEEETTHSYFKNDICSNIYTACLARVEEMSLDRVLFDSGSIAEKIRIEWETAKEKATSDIKRRTKELANARRDTELAGDAKEMKVPVEKLAEARLKTANATFYAISVKQSSLSPAAEDALGVAQAGEDAALTACFDAIRAAFAETQNRWTTFEEAAKKYEMLPTLQNAQEASMATKQACEAAKNAAALVGPFSKNAAAATRHAANAAENATLTTGWSFNVTDAVRAAQMAAAAAQRDTNDIWKQEASWAAGAAEGVSGYSPSIKTAQRATDEAQAAEAIEAAKEKEAALKTPTKSTKNINDSRVRANMTIIDHYIQNDKKLPQEKTSWKAKEAELKAKQLAIQAGELAEKRKTLEALWNTSFAEAKKALEEKLAALSDQEKSLTQEREELDEQATEAAFAQTKRKLEDCFAVLEHENKAFNEAREKGAEQEVAQKEVLAQEQQALIEKEQALEGAQKDLDAQEERLDDERHELSKEKKVLEKRLKSGKKLSAEEEEKFNQQRAALALREQELNNTETSWYGKVTGLEYQRAELEKEKAALAERTKDLAAVKKELSEKTALVSEKLANSSEKHANLILEIEELKTQLASALASHTSTLEAYAMAGSEIEQLKLEINTLKKRSAAPKDVEPQTEPQEGQRAAAQEIIQWNKQLDEVNRRARSATKIANEGHQDEATANEAVEAWNQAAKAAAAAYSWGESIIFEKKREQGPQLTEACFVKKNDLTSIVSELQKWQEKKALSEIRALAFAYYDVEKINWFTWCARWNGIITATREKLWSERLENRVNSFLRLVADTTQSLQFKLNSLDALRREIYNFSNADAYADADAYVYSYAFPYAYPYDNRYANVNAYANTCGNAYAYANANANANAVSADSVEEAEQAAALARAAHSAIAIADQKKLINAWIRPNMIELKNQLKKTEEFANAVAALKRAEGRTQVRIKPRAVALLQRLARESLEATGQAFPNYVDAILTKIKTDLWPIASALMRQFAAVSAEARPALIEQVRGELIDVGLIYPAAALSRYAPKDQPAEAAGIMRAMAQGITIAEDKGWLIPTRKENILDQRMQLLEVADFLDHVAAYWQELE